MVIMSKDAKPEVVQQAYDDYAAAYDKEIEPDSTYPALRSCINTFLNILGGSDKNIRIIDLGAGTGYAALELKKHGFTNIDGLDLSPEMLKKAKEKDAYRNYICKAVTEKRLDIPAGTYDVVLSVGAVTSGYIKSNAFDEILRLAKPGGYIIFTIRKDVMEEEKYGFSAKFQQFIDGGKWQEVKKFLSEYVIGFHKDDTKAELSKCYIIAYRVFQNE